MLTGTQFHLLLNHIPILGTIFGLLVLIGGMLCKSEILTKTAKITFVVVALLTVPAYLTGESAEESVEQLGIQESVIEAHEEAAEFAFWSMMVLGAVSLASLIHEIYSQSSLKVLTIIILLLAVFVGGYMGYVGNLGGKIRHTEIRDAAQSAQPAATEKENEQLESREDD